MNVYKYCIYYSIIAGQDKTQLLCATSSLMQQQFSAFFI